MKLYWTVGGDDLDEAMRDPEGSTINSDLENQYSSAPDDSLKVAFTKYTEASTLGVAHAQYLSDIHAAYSDIITVPLMPKLVRNVEDGLNDPSYRSFKKSVVAFLNQVEERHPEAPVMGLIPRLGWEFINDLLEVYEAHDVTTYAFDFDRCKVTTGTQLSMVAPLMQSIANRGIEEHTLFYAINPSPGTRKQAIGARPASDIASLVSASTSSADAMCRPGCPRKRSRKWNLNRAKTANPSSVCSTKRIGSTATSR
jgi:hypothetical protein